MGIDLNYKVEAEGSYMNLLLPWLIFNPSLLYDFSENNDSMTIINHQQRLHEINTLEWDELLVPDDPQKLNSPQEGRVLM